MPERIDKASKIAQTPEIQNPEQITPQDLNETMRYLRQILHVRSGLPRMKKNKEEDDQTNSGNL